jgi:outer membrane protein TolC
MTRPATRRRCCRAWPALAALSLAACATESYAPKPVDLADNAARLSARGPDAPGLRETLAAYGYQGEALARDGWPLAALTVAALHDNLEIAAARAAWRKRRAGEAAAAQGPVPALSPTIEYHNDQSPFDESPWSVGAGLELTWVTAGKTAARVDGARALTDEAGLGIAATAWRLRQQVRDGYIDCLDAAHRMALLDVALGHHEAAVDLFDKRQALGESSPAEAANARRALATARLARATAVALCRAGLARAIGASRDKLATLRLRFDDLVQAWPDPAAFAAARRAALVNRLDVRAALARYAGAEAALRLAVARQYPDVTVSPGLLWDQGDLVWSLGSTLLLTMVNGNAGAIAEAQAAREAGAADVLAVQARVQAELETALAGYDAAMGRFRAAHAAEAMTRARLDGIQRRIAGGEADRLALIRARLDLVAAREATGRERLAALRAIGALEDATQSPILGDPAVGRLLDEMAPADDRLVRAE